MTVNGKDFSDMITWLNELNENGHVWVRVELLTTFVEFAQSWGLNPQGGAINNECTEQVIYIDRKGAFASK